MLSSSMPRDLPISNGNLMINFDHAYNIRDVYYPHVGQDNQTIGDISHFGVWCDGRFAWIDSHDWQKTLDYDDDTLVTRVTCHSDALGLDMILGDTVDFDRDLFIRRIELKNLHESQRTVRVYVHFDPHLWGNNIGDTVFFDPDHKALIAYKSSVYVLYSASVDDHYGFESFAIGNKERDGMEGTWRDAEDGNLQKNPIAQGSVDATGMVELTLESSATRVMWVWWAFGKTHPEVSGLDAMVHERGAESFFKRTRDYWHLWVQRTDAPALELLSPAVQELYRKSLLIIRTQIDNGGAVIAATDSDIVQFGRDTYTYMWPRDGAIVTSALTQAGYPEITRRFFQFCAKLLTGEGFLLHKYNPDGSVGSSWHPWMSLDGRRQLPIQEDETALVVWALWKHFEKFHDVEFVKPLYKPLVKSAGNFMMRYRDPSTLLPAASYDLWEERRGIQSFTVGAVWAGLTAAARFTDAFGEQVMAEKYRKAAAEIRDATIKHLYDEKLGRFRRAINVTRESEIQQDNTIDSALCGLWAFGMFEADDPRIVSTMQQVINRLTIKTPIGGVARYENDYYHQVSKDTDNVAGNPWILCTLSVAEWYARCAQSEAELHKAIEILEWTVSHALHSGVLAEQVHPYDGSPMSVSPLTWSHAAYVNTVHAVGEKLKALRGLA
jgi:glucoamylase